MSEERLDPQAAAQHSRIHPLSPGNPPNHLRCDWVMGEGLDVKRCTKGADHTGDHKYGT